MSAIMKIIVLMLSIKNTKSEHQNKSVYVTNIKLSYIEKINMQ